MSDFLFSGLPITDEEHELRDRLLECYPGYEFLLVPDVEEADHVDDMKELTIHRRWAVKYPNGFLRKLNGGTYEEIVKELRFVRKLDATLEICGGAATGMCVGMILTFSIAIIFSMTMSITNIVAGSGTILGAIVGAILSYRKKGWRMLK